MFDSGDFTNFDEDLRQHEGKSFFEKMVLNKQKLMLIDAINKKEMLEYEVERLRDENLMLKNQIEVLRTRVAK